MGPAVWGVLVRGLRSSPCCRGLVCCVWGWLFVAGACSPCLDLGSWCSFEVAGGSLWGCGGTYCAVWSLIPFLGFCVVVSVLGPVCMAGWAWSPLWGGVPYLPWGSGCGCSTGVAGGVELLAEGCWPIRGLFGCGCDRVGVRDFGVLRSATGGDGCWVPSGRTCEPRWGVFGGVLAPI